MLWTAPLPHPNFHGYFLGVFQKPHSSPHCQETAARPSSAGRGLQSDVRFALKATELLPGSSRYRPTTTLLRAAFSIFPSLPSAVHLCVMGGTCATEGI